ncbi:MAG: ABC transporter ATP-binding protein [bacterium]
MSATTLGAPAASGHSRDVALGRRFFRYVRPYRLRLGGALALLFLSGALELAGPYLTKIAIDDGVRAGNGHTLGLVCLAFAAVLMLEFVAAYFQDLFVVTAGQAVMRDLRRDVFAHLQRMGVAWFDRNPSGRVVTRITSDVETLNELLTSGLVTILADVVTLVGIMTVLLWMNASLALLVFLILPFLVAASLSFREKARKGFRETREQVAQMSGMMQETLGGMEVVKLFGREAENDVRFDEHNAGCRDAWLDTIEAFSIFFPLVNFMLAITLATVLWGGGLRVMAGTLTFGGLVAFLQYVQRFFVPLRDLSEKYNILQGALAAAERIFGVLDAEATEDFDARTDLVRLDAVRGDVEFQHVSFHYVEGEPVLRDVSFRVRPGERVAVVGATGAGKSTVLSLLLGFYRPTSGRILVDGQDVAGLDPRSLRRRVATVAQDVFLFSADVDWNVRLGDEELPESAVDRALAASRSDRFVARLPAGRRERLGERGRNLSQGERQLLSFARALARDPDVLLLDEATASVDSETEGLVQEALGELLAGRTCLVVAHRLSTVLDADRILVMHKGELVEEGTHDELVQRGGIYARLAEIQFGFDGAAA